MKTSELYPFLYRIAELAHQGVDDDYIRDECESLATRVEDRVVSASDLYRRSEQIYRQHFESR